MNEVRYKIDVIKIQQVKTDEFICSNNVIRSPEDAANIIRNFIHYADREHFVQLCLNTKNTVVSLEVVSIGTLNAALVHPREVFKSAILSNSASVIVGHNHPTNQCDPSPEDIEITTRLVECGKILGIEFLDHIIVGDENNYCSIKEKGLM